MDWPALVALRTTVDKLIEELVEPGGLADGHHANHVQNAVIQFPTWVELGAVRPKSDVVIEVTTGENEEVVCFGCGPIKRTGYSWAIPHS